MVKNGIDKHISNKKRIKNLKAFYNTIERLEKGRLLAWKELTNEEREAVKAKYPLTKKQKKLLAKKEKELAKA